MSYKFGKEVPRGFSRFGKLEELQGSMDYSMTSEFTLGITRKIPQLITAEPPLIYSSIFQLSHYKNFQGNFLEFLKRFFIKMKIIFHI